MTFTIPVTQLSAVIPRFLPTAAGLAVALTGTVPVMAQGSLFTAVPVEEANFILVSAPIGQGERSQLNIYEQRTNKRPCFAVSGGTPAAVDPLLSSFDFTGVCNRYIDGNGYSLRLGGDDLGTRYRLTVVKTGNDIELLAAPTRNSSQPVLSGGQGWWSGERFCSTQSSARLDAHATGVWNENPGSSLHLSGYSACGVISHEIRAAVPTRVGDRFGLHRLLTVQVGDGSGDPE